MTEHEETSERWYDAGDPDEFRAFFNALWSELEPFRNAYLHKAFGPDHRRLWALIEKYGSVEPGTRTWLRIAAGMPRDPRVVVRQGRPNGLEDIVNLDRIETRELIGWRLTPD